MSDPQVGGEPPKASEATSAKLLPGEDSGPSIPEPIRPRGPSAVSARADCKEIHRQLPPVVTPSPQVEQEHPEGSAWMEA